MTFDTQQTPSIYVRKLSLKRKRIKAALTNKDFFIYKKIIIIKNKNKEEEEEEEEEERFEYFWVIFIGMN